jgi:DNA-binding MarR family transcriptional regulator/ribosomal protein S18 acetylase RimI-like enzyme
MSTYLASLGSLGFTYRLRRLSDRLQEDGRRLYSSVGIPLEPNWHILIDFLDGEGSSSVTEASAAMGVSHPTVIELARKLEAAGLIEAAVDPSDGRRRVLSLSAHGHGLLPDFRHLWDAIERELDDVIDATAGGDALSGLATIEAQLDSVGLDARVHHRLAAERDDPTRPRHERRSVAVRAAGEGDRDALLHIARELVRSADTYAYDPSIGDEELWRYWNPVGPGDGYVASLDDGVAGMFVIRPNHAGPGAHVANASYAVRADVRGIGLGRQMGEASLDIAAALGYRAMQFNAVVSTNEHAVRLWRSLGFRIVGTIPDGFRLPDGRYVPHHIMYRGLP